MIMIMLLLSFKYHRKHFMLFLGFAFHLQFKVSFFVSGKYLFSSMNFVLKSILMSEYFTGLMLVLFTQYKTSQCSAQI